MHSQWSQVESKVDDLLTRVVSLRDERERLSAEVASLREELEELRQERGQAKERLEKLLASLEALGEALGG